MPFSVFPTRIKANVTPLCATACQLIGPCHFETSIPRSTTAASEVIVGTLHNIHTASSVQRKRVTFFIYKLPFVESTSLMRASIDTASSSAFANALNTASIMWWLFSPFSIFT